MSTFSSLFFPVSVVVTNNSDTANLVASSANWNAAYTWVASNSAYATGVPAVVRNIELSATLTNSYTVSAPVGTFFDGFRYIYRLYQPNSGSSKTISVDSSIRIPSSVNSNSLQFSTTLNVFDVLAIMYNAHDSKWDVISFVPGYAYP